MTCYTCEQDPCTCQKALGVPTQWLIQHCSVPGCEVAIRVQAGKQASTNPICKWHQAGTAYYTKPGGSREPAIGPYLTREEFGLDLYEAIRLRSMGLAARQNTDRWQGQGKPKVAEEARQKANACEIELQVILSRGTIAPNDVRRLLAMGT